MSCINAFSHKTTANIFINNNYSSLQKTCFFNFKFTFLVISFENSDIDSSMSNRSDGVQCRAICTSQYTKCRDDSVLLVYLIILRQTFTFFHVYFIEAVMVCRVFLQASMNRLPRTEGV